MTIVLLSGKAQHGKDTCGQYIADMLKEHSKRVLIAHYGDLVKYICTQFFGWDGKKDEAGRAMLQRVGTDVIRKQYPDYWVNFLLELFRLFKDEWDYVIIPDVRFENEVDLFKDSEFDTIHLRVLRTDFESPLTIEQQHHPSETALDHVVPDKWIYNMGTLEELSERAIDAFCCVMDTIALSQQKN